MAIALKTNPNATTRKYGVPTRTTSGSAPINSNIAEEVNPAKREMVSPRRITMANVCFKVSDASLGFCIPMKRATSAVVPTLSAMNTDWSSITGWFVRPTAVIASGPTRPTCIMSAIPTSDTRTISTSVGAERRHTTWRAAALSNAGISRCAARAGSLCNLVLSRLWFLRYSSIPVTVYL